MSYSLPPFLNFFFNTCKTSKATTLIGIGLGTNDAIIIMIILSYNYCILLL